MSNINKGTIGAKKIAASLQTMLQNTPGEVRYYFEKSNYRFNLGGYDYLQFSDGLAEGPLLGRDNPRMEIIEPKPISAEQAARIWDYKIHFYQTQKCWDEVVARVVIALAQERVINEFAPELSGMKTPIQLTQLAAMEQQDGKLAFVGSTPAQLKEDLIKRLLHDDWFKDTESLKTALSKGVEEIIFNISLTTKYDAGVLNAAAVIVEFLNKIPADVKSLIIAESTPIRLTKCLFIQLEDQDFRLFGCPRGDDPEMPNHNENNYDTISKVYSRGFADIDLNAILRESLEIYQLISKIAADLNLAYGQVPEADRKMLISKNSGFKIDLSREVSMTCDYSTDALLFEGKPLSVAVVYNMVRYNIELAALRKSAADAGKLLSGAINYQLLMMKPAKEQRRQIISGLCKMVSDADLALPEKAKAYERKLTELIKDILAHPELLLMFENREISINCSFFSISFVAKEMKIRLCSDTHGMSGRFMEREFIGGCGHPFSPMFEAMFMKEVEIADVARFLAKFDSNKYSTNSLEDEWTKALRDIFSRLSI
jgi:hypothetical protein